MVADLLRLRVDLTVGSWRGSVGTRVVQSFLLVVIIFALAILLGNASDWFAADPYRFSATAALIGGALSATFFVISALSSVQDPFDPRRFISWFIPKRDLALTIPLVSLLSPWIALTVALIIVALSSQSDLSGGQWVLALVAAVLILVQNSLLSRLGFAISARWHWRKYRAFVLLLLLLAVWSPVLWFGVFSPLPDSFAELFWLPFIAPWSLLLPVSLGSLPVIWPILATLFFLAIITFAWFIALQSLLTRPNPWVQSQLSKSMGGFIWFPDSPVGVIAARSSVYWFRDSRYWINLVIIPFFAVLIVPPFLIAGVPFAIAVMIPVPIVGLYLGWLLHNDLAYDSSALWLHFAARVTGIADRLGRVAVPLLLGSVLMVVLSSAAIILNGDWFFLPAIVGLSLGALWSALGGSSIASALVPYPATRPGNSPFQQPQRSGAGVFYSLVVVFAMVAIGIVPILLLAIFSWGSSSVILSAITLVVALLWGAFVFVAGNYLGAKVFDQRRDQLMQFAEVNG